MKKYIIGILIYLCGISISFAQGNVDRYSIDLVKVENDKVKVVLLCPQIKEASAVFVMPRVIPGSYSWKEYGRFVTAIKGFDAAGAPVKISRKKNIFYIKKNADKLVRLEYLVDDTWDDTNLNQFIFQPGGSNIEDRKNYVLNGHAFMGYFEGYKNLPFEVEVTKPDFMYGSTWLKKEALSREKDLIKAPDYEVLADNPVMYCEPDTASFRVDETRVFVSCYSNTGMVHTDSISKWLQPLAFALRNFLGKLPVQEYHFIFYFASDYQLPKVPPGKGLSGYGALEHNHCSFYFLPERPNSEEVREMVQDVSAHEFLHIITPLNLHSKEIADFNFMDPKMSQHLWMYEGVTEYFSWLVRAQYKLVKEEDFIKEMKQKLQRAETYGFFSFTEMSKRVLEPAYQEKYSNVYQKGAVIAMMLDQLLLKKSGGQYGLKHLMLNLMSRYGAEKAFEDDKFFAEIASLTYPEVTTFINSYIVGEQSLPVQEYMDWFGYDYEAAQKVTSYYIGSFAFRVNDNDQMEVVSVGPSVIDLMAGDIILTVNGNPANGSNFTDIFENYFQYNSSPNNVVLKIKRGGQEIIRRATPVEGQALKRHVFTKQYSASEEKRKLFDAWLNGKYVEAVKQ